MDLNNKNVCFVAAFNCPYGGNFIPMLRSLAYRLRDNFHVQVSFVFPKQSRIISEIGWKILKKIFQYILPINRIARL